MAETLGIGAVRPFCSQPWGVILDRQVEWQVGNVLEAPALNHDLHETPVLASSYVLNCLLKLRKSYVIGAVDVACS